jgi:hypothetical protein
MIKSVIGIIKSFFLTIKDVLIGELVIVIDFSKLFGFLLRRKTNDRVGTEENYEDASDSE